MITVKKKFIDFKLIKLSNLKKTALINQENVIWNITRQVWLHWSHAIPYVAVIKTAILAQVGWGWNWLCGSVIEINSCNGSGGTRPASIKTTATGANYSLRNNAGTIDRLAENASSKLNWMQLPQSLFFPAPLFRPSTHDKLNKNPFQVKLIIVVHHNLTKIETSKSIGTVALRRLSFLDRPATSLNFLEFLRINNSSNNTKVLQRYLLI